MELWDVYDRHGNITGETRTRDDTFHEGEYHLAASLWIVNSKGELLIQKRSPTKRVWPGKWCITGGSVKAGEDSRQGCVREVAEEIGIKVSMRDIELLYRIYERETIFDDYVIVLDFPLSDICLQQEEVSDIQWASVEEVRELFRSGEFMFDDVEGINKVGAYIRKRAHDHP